MHAKCSTGLDKQETQLFCKWWELREIPLVSTYTYVMYSSYIHFVGLRVVGYVCFT